MIHLHFHLLFEVMNDHSSVVNDDDSLVEVVEERVGIQ